jgi:hypothetical protein
MQNREYSDPKNRLRIHLKDAGLTLGAMLIVYLVWGDTGVAGLLYGAGIGVVLLLLTIAFVFSFDFDSGDDGFPQ